MCSGPAGFTDEATLQGLQMLAYGLDNLPIEQVYDLKLQHDSSSPAYVAPPEDIAAFLRKRFTGNVPVSLAEVTRRLIDTQDQTDQLAKSGVRAQVLYGEGDDGWPIPVQRAMAEAPGRGASGHSRGRPLPCDRTAGATGPPPGQVLPRPRRVHGLTSRLSALVSPRRRA